MASSPELRVIIGSPERRAEIAARTGTDEAMIERLVRSFYDHVADDPLLGPFFDKSIASSLELGAAA